MNEPEMKRVTIPDPANLFLWVVGVLVVVAVITGIYDFHVSSKEQAVQRYIQAQAHERKVAEQEKLFREAEQHKLKEMIKAAVKEGIVEWRP